MDNYCQNQSTHFPNGIGSYLPKILLERHPLPSAAPEAAVKIDGKQRRYDIVDTLRRLANLAHSPSERNQLRDLANLCAFTANDKAWTTSDGPLIGARNETIAKILAHDRGDMSAAVAGRHIAALYRAGWLDRENLAGNHKRYWTKDATSGLDYGRGYRLRPVLREYDALKRELERREAARRHDESLLRNLYSQLLQFIETSRDNVSLSAARKLQRAITRISPISSRFGATVMQLIARFEAIIIGSDPAISTDQSSDISRPIYEPDNSFRSSKGNASKHIKTQASAPKKNWRKAASTQYLGIDEARLTHSEIHTLFPVLETTENRYVGQQRIIDKAWQLAKQHRLDLELISQAMHKHDQLAVAMIVFVTVQKFADGKLWASPASYFKGMVRKARLGSLNLCPTIFGQRRGQ